MAKHNRLPKYNELLNPLVQALRDLGGSVASIRFHATVLPHNY